MFEVTFEIFSFKKIQYILERTSEAIKTVIEVILGTDIDIAPWRVNICGKFFRRFLCLMGHFKNLSFVFMKVPFELYGTSTFVVSYTTQILLMDGNNHSYVLCKTEDPKCL